MENEEFKALSHKQLKKNLLENRAFWLEYHFGWIADLFGKY